MHAACLYILCYSYEIKDNSVLSQIHLYSRIYDDGSMAGLWRQPWRRWLRGRRWWGRALCARRDDRAHTPLTPAHGPALATRFLTFWEKQSNCLPKHHVGL